MIAAQAFHHRGAQWPGLALTVLLTLALALSMGCGPTANENASAESSRNDPGGGNVRIVNVEVSPIELSDFVDYMGITGEVRAYQEAVLSAEEGGVVESFEVKKGQWVRKGQPVVQLDDDVLTNTVEEARATAELAEEHYRRQKRLWEEEGIGSEIAYLEAKYDDMVSKAKLASLETRLQKTVIRAPFAGVFDENFLEVGEYARPGAQVVRIVDASRVKVTGGVPERFARSVHVGDKAEVTFDIFPGTVMTGSISFVGRTVDAGNRTFPIELVLDNPEGEIKPRMVANVRVVRGRFEQVVVIPQEAVLRTENGHQAYVIERQSDKPVARARDLELGPSARNRVVVRSGLKEGELLITVGQRLVDDEAPVRIINEDQLGGQGEGKS